jgi:hypothetical protein
LYFEGIRVLKLTERYEVYADINSTFKIGLQLIAEKWQEGESEGKKENEKGGD